ncbi:MAG: hypothetical protein QXE80_09260 [Pyrobaculum sp.]
MLLRNVRVFRFWKFRRVIKDERYIPKGRALIIAGGYGAGKTRELQKLHAKAVDIWGREGVYIPVGESLENWFKRAGLSNDDLKGLRQFEKVGKLIERCKGKVVILDDVDRAESKVKVDAVKWLIRVADVVVVSCQDIHRVNEGLEYELRKKLKLKPHESINRYVVDLGKQEVEVKDVGMIVAIGLIVFVAFAWGLTWGLMGALAFRYLVAEGKKS